MKTDELDNVAEVNIVAEDELVDGDAIYDDRAIPRRPDGNVAIIGASRDALADGGNAKARGHGGMGFNARPSEWKHPDHNFRSLWESKTLDFWRDAVRYAAAEIDAAGEPRPVCAFSRFYPTYRDMSEEILHEYFAWRTRARLGIYDAAPLSFATLHAYELIAGIGTLSVEDGFRRLAELDENYSKNVDEAGVDIFHEHMVRWRRDYAIYYGMGIDDAPEIFETILAADEMREVLLYPSGRAPDDIYPALLAASSYAMERSAFVRKYPADAAKIYGRVYARLARLYEESNLGNLGEKIVGEKSRRNYQMFLGAVFYDSGKGEDVSREIDSIRRVERRNGEWFIESYGLSATIAKSRELGELMREADRLMRIEFNFGHAMKRKAELPDAVSDAIGDEIKLYNGEKLEASRPRIEIDVSRLAGIRRNAEATRDKLLDGIEDEVETDMIASEKTMPMNENMGTRKEKENNAASGLPNGLSSDEADFLRLLIIGKPYDDFARERHVFASVLADGINEKLIDELGDTAVEENDDGLYVIVEDYLDDVKGLINGQQ